MRSLTKTKSILALCFACSFASDAIATPTAPSTEYLGIRGQADAFKTAAEVASAFGVYMTQKKDSNFDFQQTGTKVVDCMNNQDKCSEADVFKALIQYNVNKEVEAMVLKNSTNAKNLETLDGHGIPKDGDAKVEYGGPRQVFKINIDPDFGAAQVDVKKLKEQEILGKDFLTSYRQFVDAYSKPNKDNYVQVKNEFDPVTGKMMEVAGAEDTAAYNRDLRNQSAKAFTDKANALKANAVEPKVETEKDGTLALHSGLDQGSLGFNDRVSEETAKKYAEGLNNVIDQQLLEQKKQGSLSTADVSYTISASDFNGFLNQIWPPAAGPRTR